MGVASLGVALGGFCELGSDFGEAGSGFGWLWRAWVGVALASLGVALSGFGKPGGGFGELGSGFEWLW